ncbi:MAG: efflux RND transporter permease subunit, partial [Gammaproteobacteria bacterium]
MFLHEAAQRVQTVTSYLSGRSLTGFVHEAETNLHAANLPPGTYAVFSGAAQARAQATHELLLKTAVAIAAIMMLLFLALRSMRSLLLVLVNLPFALVGGVAAVLLMGGVVSIGSLVGFVTLFGITLRNSIMLISHYKHLVQAEGMTWGPEAALRGASERLVPILMTALVTALALLPLAIGSNVPGQEIEGPMAIVILGGLITSTVLNLLILPAIALKFGRFDKITAQTDLLM